MMLAFIFMFIYQRCSALSPLSLNDVHNNYFTSQRRWRGTVVVVVAVVVRLVGHGAAGPWEVNVSQPSRKHREPLTADNMPKLANLPFARGPPPASVMVFGRRSSIIFSRHRTPGARGPAPLARCRWYDSICDGRARI